jgi:O-antigen ligase
VTSPDPAPPPPLPPPALLALLAAALLPTFLAFSQPPSPTVYNHLLALALWGVTLGVLAARPAAGSARAAIALLSALGACVVAQLGSVVLGSLPPAFGLSTGGLVVAAALVAASGARAHADAPLRHAFFTALLLAGLCSAFVGAGQVFMPQALDGDWFAHSSMSGRAVGNLRQPNHLATLLLWSALAVLPLHAAGRLRAAVALPVFAGLVFALVLTASRTGVVGVLVLAAWGVLDRRLPRFVRALLVGAPLMYAAGWLAMSWWAEATAQTFGGAARAAGEGLNVGSRPLIWRDTLALIAAHPWLGVGAGEYNLAWSLTPSPQRSGEFFDHSHNLPLQLLAEYGLPLGGAVIGLLLLALWQAWRRSGTHLDLRTAFVMVLLMGVHSQLEYPLWYAYFLLPTAFAWGLCLGGAAPQPISSTSATRGAAGLRIAGVAMVAAAVFAGVDYRRVVAVYAPGANDAPLAERVADGQRSLLFPHHADYAAATMSEHPGTQMAALQRASHYLLDTRLMTAWARAYAERGDLDRARHLAERLREFNNPASAEFFAPCKPAAASAPFQCAPPARALDWRDFVVR